jgi:hypothetical protein
VPEARGTNTFDAYSQCQAKCKKRRPKLCKFAIVSEKSMTQKHLLKIVQQAMILNQSK